MVLDCWVRPIAPCVPCSWPLASAIAQRGVEFGALRQADRFAAFANERNLAIHLAAHECLG